MTDRPVFIIPTLQNCLIIQIISPYEIDFRLGKNMWFHLDDGVYKGKTRGRRDIRTFAYKLSRSFCACFRKEWRNDFIYNPPSFAYFTYVRELKINQRQFMHEFPAGMTHTFASSRDVDPNGILRADDVGTTMYTSKRKIHRNLDPFCFHRRKMITYNYSFQPCSRRRTQPNFAFHMEHTDIHQPSLIFFHPISLKKTPDLFDLTEQEGMLSSLCILNIKRLVILKCQ